MSLENKGTVKSTDVLIIGHGLSGLANALSIKEKNPNLDILLVDKASTGYAGKANKGACVVIDIAPEHTADEIVEWHVRKSGEYLNNQDLYKKFIESMPSVIDKMEEWGTHVARQENGDVKLVPSFPKECPWGLALMEYDFLIKFAARAKKLGCKFMDKTTITDILTDGNKVVGAVGFSLLDGEKFIFKAKSIVIANGNQDYRGINMWDCARGDGIAAAFRAGAEMRNGEFGTFKQAMYCDFPDVPLTAEDHIYNEKGEWLTPKFRPWVNDPNFDMSKYWGTMIYDSNNQMFAGMYKDALAGNGPHYLNAAEYKAPERLFAYAANPEFSERPKWIRWNGIFQEKVQKGLINNKGPMIPVTAGLIGEQSPIKVDNDFRTSIEGLWAIGDSCYNGSGVPGAVPAPPARLRGSGLAFATFSAIAAAPSVAAFSAKEGSINEDQVDQYINDFMAPKMRYAGVNPNEIMSDIRAIMASMKYTGSPTEEVMQEGLALVQKEKEKLNNVYAKNWHYLSAANEARSFVLCAEIHFTTAQLRKESRGWFMRDDYPERDDANYLKYINFQKDAEAGIRTWMTDVPLADYPYQPE